MAELQILLRCRYHHPSWIPGFHASSTEGSSLPSFFLFVSSIIFSPRPFLLLSSSQGAVVVPDRNGVIPRETGPTEYTRNTKQRSSERRSFELPFFLCLPPPRPFSLLFFLLKGNLYMHVLNLRPCNTLGRVGLFRRKKRGFSYL